ncbi:MAG TPA: hypothetical protein VF178_16010 [Gemmatimonadaceae bacterium]
MRNWRQIAAPVLVFVLGAICGGGGMAFYALQQVREAMTAPPAEERQIALRLMTRQLRLDPSQQAAAAPVFATMAQRLAEIRRESQPKVREAIKDAAEELRPLLRPRQQQRLDQMLARAQMRWERSERAPRSPERSSPSRNAGPE